MKDIYTVIRQKEADLERIQKEIEALRFSARLLEETEQAGPISASATATPTSAFPAATPKPQNASRPAAAPAAWASAKQFP